MAFIVILHMLGVPTGMRGVVFGMIMFPGILLLSLQSKIINKILSFAPLVYLGKISFSIYLCNYSIEIFTDILNQSLDLGINFSSSAFFFCNIAVHIVVATVFWKVFEDILPGRLKKKYVISDKRGDAG